MQGTGLRGITDASLRDLIRPRVAPDVVAWIQSAVDLSRDPSAAVPGLVHLDAYQIEPIRAQYDPATREVVIVAVEQTGKSSVWRWPAAHRLLFRPGPAWVIYESDDKAEDINAEQFDPLLRSIPEIEAMLNRSTATKRRYMLRNGAVLDFSGAGADITSKPRRDGVADELDRWPLTPAGIRQNLRNFRKRFRTYWRRGEGCLVIVSSPKGESSPVWDEWENSSRGQWHLRCRACGQLTIPSHAVHCLQWEMTPDGETLLPATIRLECPACGHEHAEAEAVRCNLEGAYVHAAGDNAERRGFQWGALACPRVFSWRQIAEAQLSAGRTADPAAQADFDNSWRGLPFRPRRTKQPVIDAIRAHCAPLPDPAGIAAVLFSADTQDDGWYWVVRGVDARGCMYLLGSGRARPFHFDRLKEAWDAKYCGLQPVLGIIDEGGHHSVEVQQFCAATSGLYAYKGESRIGVPYKLSTTEPSRILAIAKHYQAQLLYYIYSQGRRDNAYWFLPPDVPAEYVAQIGAPQPAKTQKHGDRYENWEPPSGAADHWFDAEKMALVLLDFARDNLTRWRLPVRWAKQANRGRETRRAQIED